MEKQYLEVNSETIELLKSKGFVSAEFVLLDQGNPYVSTIEVRPGKEETFTMDVIALQSGEIQSYMDRQSPMAKYIIDQNYL